jgi:hypothetical protein
MTKDEFAAKYKNDIGLSEFMWDVFLAQSGIEIDLVEKTVDEIQGFYVARYQKNGQWDPKFDRFINVINDPDVKPVKVKDVLQDLESWDLNSDSLTPAENLHPIPIATDISGKTLILDSNHTLCGHIANSRITSPVRFVELKFDYVESVILDFLIIKRPV